MSELEPRMLTVEVSEPSPGVDLVTLKGELDFASGADVSAALSGLTGGRRVVVDLSGLDFIDSSGVKMMVAAARAIDSAGGVLVLAAPTPTVRRVFEILHLEDVLNVVEDREQAVAEAAGAAVEPRAQGDAG